MGQITNPIVKGITVNPVDRQSGPGAGAGSTANNSVFLGSGAGANSAVADLVIIGKGSGGGGIVGADLEGSVIVGVDNAPSVTVGAGNALPLTVVGSDNLSQWTTGIDSTVIVGGGNLNGGSSQALSKSVFVGNALFPTASIFPAFANAVVIGANIDASATAGNISIANNSVLIGADMFVNFFAGQYVHDVFIGGGIEFPQSSAGLSNNFNIGIGYNILVPRNAGNISIGSGGFVNTGGANNASENVCIGDAAHYSGNSNVVIGAGATNPQVAIDGNFGCVIIGVNAGQSISGSALTNVFLIEAATNTGAGSTPSALLYGSFLTGNLILGNSTVAGLNRDFGGVPGSNIVKLLNGTRSTGTAIAGGGYFYVTGGFLHWVDQNGIDSQLSESVQGQLASSALAAFTNNAGASAGTLTNAPAAGNPTKWIPINDAGTIRNIPAW